MLECYTERHPTAKKEHYCDLCGGLIPPGEKYYRFSGVDSGEFFDQKYHTTCESVLQAYTKESGDYDEIDFWNVKDWVQERVCESCKNFNECKKRKKNIFLCEKVISTYN